MPAEEWAAGMGELLDQVEASGQFADPSTRRKMKQARRLIGKGELTATQACSLFREMTTIQGIEGGGDWIVNFVPNREAPQAVNAQQCFDGKYTSVQLESPNLEVSDAEMRRIKHALDEAR
ncbi:MAG: hypothetical protein ACRDWY_04765 [Actinomycetes bacterium]